MKPTEFKIGELVKYPVYDDGGGETCLAVGIVVDLTKEDMSDLPSYMKAEIGEDAPDAVNKTPSDVLLAVAT